MTDSPPSPGPRVSIDDQIGTLRNLLDKRSNYLADKIASGKVRQETADREIDALEEALKTLSFVRRYADEFRDFIRRKREFEAERRQTLEAET